MLMCLLPYLQTPLNSLLVHEDPRHTAFVAIRPQIETASGALIFQLSYAVTSAPSVHAHRLRHCSQSAVETPALQPQPLATVRLRPIHLSALVLCVAYVCVFLPSLRRVLNGRHTRINFIAHVPVVVLRSRKLLQKLVFCV